MWQLQLKPTLEVYSGFVIPIIALDVYDPPSQGIQCTIQQPYPAPVAQFQVWKAIDAGAFALFATIASTATLFFNNGAGVAGQTIHYKIRYKNGSVLGPFSNVVSVLLV